MVFDRLHLVGKRISIGPGNQSLLVRGGLVLVSYDGIIHIQIKEDHNLNQGDPP